MAGGSALGSSAGVGSCRVILANLQFTSPPAFSRGRLAAGSRAICALTGRGVKDCNITREQRTEKRARQRRAGETHPYMGGDHFDILVETHPPPSTSVLALLGRGSDSGLSSQLKSHLAAPLWGGGGAISKKPGRSRPIIGPEKDDGLLASANMRVSYTRPPD